MQRLTLAALVLALAVGDAAGSARAAWTDFVALGSTPILSDIACSSGLPGQATCVGIGPGHGVYVIRYGNGDWTSWSPYGTVSTSAPSCGTPSDGLVACASTKPTVGGMVLDVFGGPGQSSELALSGLGLLPSDPSCVSLQAGRVFCAAATLTRGVGGVVHGLVGVTFDRATSKVAAATRLMNGTNYSRPGCAPDGLGHAVCAWNSVDGHVVVRKYLGRVLLPWTAELDLRGLAVTAPQCVYSGVPGVVGCIAISTDSTAYGTEYNGGAFTAADWSGYTAVAGPITGIGCAGLGAVGGRASYVCGVVAAIDNHFYTGINTGQGWGGYVLHRGYYVGNSVKMVYEPGYFVGNPTCFPIDRTVTPARVMCVVRSDDFTAYSTIGP